MCDILVDSRTLISALFFDVGREIVLILRSSRNYIFTRLSYKESDSEQERTEEAATETSI